MHFRVWSCALSANMLRLARTSHFTLSCSILQVAAAASRALEEAPLQQDALFAPSSTPTMKQLQREHEEQYRYQQQQQQVPWLLPSWVRTDFHPKDHPLRVFHRITPPHDAALLRFVLHTYLVLLRWAQLQLLLPPALQFAWAQQQSQPQPTSLDLHGQPYLPMGGYHQQQQQQGMPPQQQLPYGTADAYHAGPLQPLPQYMPVAAADDTPPNFPGLPDFVGGTGGLANSMSGSVGGGVPGYAPSSVPAYGTSGSDPAYGGVGGGGSDPAYGGGGGGSDPMGVPSRDRVSSGSSGNVDIGGSGSWGSHGGAAAMAGSGAAARPGSAAVGATPMAARVGSGGAGGIDDTGSPAALHVEDKIAKIKEKNRWAGQWRCATSRWAPTGDERNDVHVFQATAVYVLAGHTGHLAAVASGTKYSS